MPAGKSIFLPRTKTSSRSLFLPEKVCPTKLSPRAISFAFIASRAATPTKTLASCPSIVLSVWKSVSILPLLKIFLARRTLTTEPSPGKPFAKTKLPSTKTSSTTRTEMVSPSCMVFELTGTIVSTFIIVLVGIWTWESGKISSP